MSGITGEEEEHPANKSARMWLEYFSKIVSPGKLTE
jgi:hypothetical protein